MQTLKILIRQCDAYVAFCVPNHTKELNHLQKKLDDFKYFHNYRLRLDIVIYRK